VIILDTCVISGSLKENQESAMFAWMAGLKEETVFIPSIVIGELRKGVELLEKGKKKQALELWLEQLQDRFSGRILPIDEGTALVWGSLCARLTREGRPVPVSDSLIAASSLFHDALLATRNTKDFEGMGLRLVNPWEI
jgi:toxin FitB